MLPRDNEALMRVSEAAVALGINTAQVYRLIDKGALDHEVWNRHHYVTRESVETRLRLLELPDRYISLTEAAEWFHVSRRTITRWVHDGRLSPISTAGRTLFDPVHIAEVAGKRALGHYRGPGRPAKER